MSLIDLLPKVTIHVLTQNFLPWLVSFPLRPVPDPPEGALVTGGGVTVVVDGGGVVVVVVVGGGAEALGKHLYKGLVSALRS
jgi:hypothetical protein